MSVPELQHNGLMVFSDLDGTLLDHQTYDWSPAKPALERLRAAGHALILASSKTAAEMAPLRAELGFAHCPAIVENGAGILQGEKNVEAAAHGNDRGIILEKLASLPIEVREPFSGFSDWTIEQIAEKTGLAVEKAALAANRQYSEPGRWSGTPEGFAAFSKQTAQRGIHLQRGGRFITLSLGANKAARMVDLIPEAKQGKVKPLIVALGDAPNDREMLENGDISFVIDNPHGSPMPELVGERSGKIRRSAGTGPEGWNESVLSVLNEFIFPQAESA